MQAVVLGYSGHALVVVETALQMGYRLIGYAEGAPKSFNPYHLNYLGSENDPSFAYWSKGQHFIIGIGDNGIRRKLSELVLSMDGTLPQLIHPDSSVSEHSALGKGVFVARQAAINPFATVGDFVIVNTAAVIEHECEIGAGAHIAPGAVLAGNVRVGKNSFIGANAVIKQGIVVGDDVTVGAGAVIVKNVPSGMTVVGNPAKPLTK